MNKELKRYLDSQKSFRLNLQHFAEGDDEGDDVEPDDVDDEPADDKKDDEPEKKYSDDDVNRLLNQKRAKWEAAKEKELKDAKDEAARLAKMNKEQKDEHERQKLQEELDEYKRKDRIYQMSREASRMLSEHDITADDDVLDLVVREDADETKASVDAFVSLVNKKVEEGVKKALSGKSPKRTKQTPKTMTREKIMQIKDASERQKAIQDNIHLFK